MCGICGYISRKDITIEQLKTMNDTMYHRGPDDSGEEIFAMKGGRSVGLAQRRLSILDLSPLGHQPMHSKDKRLSVVFNGEIYNFQEIRTELSDYDFLSHCDTEVIIAAYLKWGIPVWINLTECMQSVFMTEKITAFILFVTVSEKSRYIMNSMGKIYILHRN